MGATLSGLPRLFPTVVHMLADAAVRRPDAPALKDWRQSLTYGEYARCVAGLAREIAAHAAPGAVVLTLLDNAAETCVALYAAMASGAQVCSGNPAYTARELREIIEDAAPAVAIVHAARLGVYRAAIEGLPAHALIVVEDAFAFLAPWRGEAALALDPSKALPDALAVLQYTGGTTGRAKGVQLTHRAVAANVAQREALLPTRMDRERILCLMPLFHSFASAMCLHLAAACRGTLVILERYRPDLVTEALAQERITLFPAGPTVFNGLLGYAPFVERAFPDLAACYSGSAALPDTVLQRWKAVTGCDIFEGYGQTEAGPVLTYHSPFAAPAPRTVGRALPYTEIEIVDAGDPDRTLPVGEVGEIRARGPQLMAGYRNRPAETAEALRKGWLHTGDIGRLDAEGRLFIEDRKKDMVIVSGYNVYPREVDEVLLAHPDVAEAAVVGVPDAYRGEALRAYIVPRPGRRLDAAQLEVHCRENLARYKAPSVFVFLDALPKTAVGKIDKKALRALDPPPSAPLP